MKEVICEESQTERVTNFEDLVSRPFDGNINAICWARELKGDFSEIVKKVKLQGNITEIGQEELRALRLSEAGQLARETLLRDLELLSDWGAAPVLNVIRHYERDEEGPFFPTDVYSFHADRSPLPVDTFLCTYYGAASEILPNSQGMKKVLIPEIREKLKKNYQGSDENFESFLAEHSLDLHYQAQADARIISLGVGNLWKLAVEHPSGTVPPCLHRAPIEKAGEDRLLLIC